MISISTKEFIQLANYMRSNYGINLKMEKKYLVVGRLQNLLAEKKMNSFTDYFEYVLSDKTGQALTMLINKLTTNHTFFMREREHFDYFRSTALPNWANSQAISKDLRTWSAGCSTGEEPYTIAMIIADYFGDQKEKWDTRILASDISEQAITSAGEGIYLNEQMAVLPNKWQRNYFVKIDDDRSEVVDRIKQEVIFRRCNLMSEVFPFKKKFHVIFCRNVMIYFDTPTKNELVNKFYEATESGGYLFVGHAESLDRNETRYKYIIPAVYRKE
ncbi:MAG: chemotaxis protein CheR [Firmicutes bacterium HGW-Firmicutes-15]|nr:MAG: chemotaxis protein CheR [Firmicutes bacterium HGW-Firmicutes-15]